MSKKKMKKNRRNIQSVSIEKMQIRFVNLLNKMIQLSKKPFGNNESFRTLMKEFDVVRWYLHNEKDESRRKYFFNLICLLYKNDGNKFRSGFIDFYDYISKYNYFLSDKEQIAVYRTMCYSEYKFLKNSFNINPSWSEVYQNTVPFGLSKLIMREAKKCVLVLAIFDKSDVIYKFENDENESEIFVNNKAIPKYVGNLFDFNNGYFKRRLGININEILLTPLECRNSYGVIPSITSKGIKISEDDSVSDVFNSVCIRRLKNHIYQFSKN